MKMWPFKKPTNMEEVRHKNKKPTNTKNIVVKEDKPVWMQNQTKLHLVVDDSDTNRLVLRKYLEMIDLKADEGSNGIQCLEKVKDNLNKYDVIWMDIRMPYKDGYETTIELRALGYERMIIGLTGHVDSDSLKKCIEIGMDKVVAKPIIREELYGLLYHLGIDSEKLAKFN